MNEGLIAALALAAAIGLSLGALGSGGSIITLPILVYVAGIPEHDAVGMSLAVVGLTSLAAALIYYNRGEFHAKATLLWGPPGMIAAYFSSALTHLMSGAALMLLFASLMLAAGLRMLRRRPEASGASRCHLSRCLPMGALVGGLTGFLGVGGGFLIVPALILFVGLPAKQAVGASLAIITLNSGAGLLGQLRFAEFDWTLTAAFLGSALTGVWLGTRVVQRVSNEALHRAFAWFVIVLGGVIGLSSLARLL